GFEICTHCFEQVGVERWSTATSFSFCTLLNREIAQQRCEVAFTANSTYSYVHMWLRNQFAIMLDRISNTLIRSSRGKLLKVAVVLLSLLLPITVDCVVEITRLVLVTETMLVFNISSCR